MPSDPGGRVETRASEIAVLKWAAGAAIGIPDEVSLDQGRLLDSISFHHLSTRFHRRLSTDHPRWADSELTATVAELAASAVARSGQHVRAAAQLTRTLADLGLNVVLLKGVSYYLHTGDELTLTWSGDIDLIADDPYEVLLALTARGFAVDHKDPPQPHGRAVFHELAKLQRGDLLIDLHAHFPVWAYPIGLEQQDPSAHPGVWPCVSAVHSYPLAGSELLAGSVLAGWGETGPVRICGPEATALVSAAHVFASYLTELTREYATVRLGELANLATLLSGAGFDWSRFRDLAAATGARDAVGVTALLTDYYLGTDLCPRWFQGPPPPRQLPRDLWFARGEGGFLVSLDGAEDFDDLLLRHTSMRAVVARLQGAVVPAEQSRYWVALGDGAARLDRVLVSDLPGGQLGFRFAGRWHSDGLDLEVRLPVQPPAVQVDVHVNVRDVVVELVRHSPTETYAYDRLSREKRTFAVPVSAWTENHEQAFRLRLPWSALAAAQPPGRPEPAPGELPMLLGVRTWEPDGRRPRASTLVPLVLVPG